MPQAVESVKRTGFAIFQDDPRARHPVSPLTMDQMSNDIECTPSIRAFILLGPSVREPSEKRIEYRRSVFEKCDGFRQVELRSVYHSCVDVRGRALDLTLEKGGDNED